MWSTGSRHSTSSSKESFVLRGIFYEQQAIEGVSPIACFFFLYEDLIGENTYAIACRTVKMIYLKEAS